MAQQGRWMALTALLLGALVLAAAVPAQAASGDCNTCPMTRKLGRGLANTVFGIVELPAGMIETSRVHGQVAGFFVGTLKGICRTLMRTGAGVIDVVTFPFPVPKENYGPMVDPEFPPNLNDL